MSLKFTNKRFSSSYGSIETVVAVKSDQPDNKQARCFQCYQLSPSHSKLPFWERRPHDPHDQYYCGCKGWE